MLLIIYSLNLPLHRLPVILPSSICLAITHHVGEHDQGIRALSLFKISKTVTSRNDANYFELQLQRILGSYFEDFALTHNQAEHVVKFRENLQWRRRLNHLFWINLQIP